MMMPIRMMVGCTDRWRERDIRVDLVTRGGIGRERPQHAEASWEVHLVIAVLMSHPCWMVLQWTAVGKGLRSLWEVVRITLLEEVIQILCLVQSQRVRYCHDLVSRVY